MSFEVPELKDLQKQIERQTTAGDLDGALESYDQMIRIAPSVEARSWCWFQKGELLMGMGRLDTIECAEEVFRIAKAHPLDDLTLVCAFAEYLLALSVDRETAQARAHANQAAQRIEQADRETDDPEDRIRFRAMLGELYEILGRYDDAIRVYEALLNPPYNDEAKLWATRALASAVGRTRSYADARPLFEQALALSKQMNSDVSLVLWQFASFEWEADHFDTAAELCQRALERIGEDPVLAANDEHVAELHWRIARALYDHDDFQGTIGHATEAVRRTKPVNWLAGSSHLLLGHSFGAIGQTSVAKTHYEQTLRCPSATDDVREQAYAGLMLLAAPHQGGKA